MPERIIRATAVIAGKDEMGPAERSVLEKIAHIRKALESAGNANGLAAEADKVTAAVGKTEAALRAIDRYNGALGGIEGKLRRVMEAEIRFHEVKRQIDDADGKMTDQLGKSWRAAEAEVRRATAALEQQRAVTGEARHQLEEMGISVEQLASEEARLTGAVNRTAEAFERQGAAARRAAAREAEAAHQRRRFAEGAIGTAATVGAPYMAGHGVAAAAVQGANLEHELARMQASGMEPGEIEEARAAAMQLSGKYRAFNSVDILHMLRNARGVVGNYDEASQIADPLLALRTVALGAHPDHAEELEADFDKLVKGMEIKGVTQNLPAFRQYMEGMAKAVNVFGDTLRPTDYYDMFKYGRASTLAASPEFMLSVAPTIAQEMRGSSAGRGFEAIYTAINGGHMQHTSVLDMDELGLVDHRKISRTKTGAIKGVLPGGIVGSDLAASNPYEWVKQTYLPALAKAGVDINDKNAVIQRAATDFSNQYAAQIIGIFATQQARIEKDKSLVGHAKGLEAAPQFMREDPVMGWREMVAQLDNLMSAVTQPGMKAAAQVLYGIAGGLQAIAASAKDHPYLTAAGVGAVGVAGAGVAGYSAYKLLAAGPALSGAAAELTAAAAALERAAAARGVPGGAALPGAPGKGIPGVGTARTALTGLNLLSLTSQMSDWDGEHPILKSFLGFDTKPAPGTWQADPTAALLAKFDSLLGIGGSHEPAKAEAELKGAAQVSVTVKAIGGQVTDAHTSSSGNIHTDLGTTMTDAMVGGGVW